ncbi:thioesterase II family protein [Streptomyces sp. NBC_01296]|uniref:thioesterase II family protein n=1 Tax=Streptomyces sp. NBC_01296 TaxID=2903816 RepID=UPI002E13EA4E|nr:alpha/beta fold hydrolase [Streptomyces sp. NBC_01296]
MTQATGATPWFRNFRPAPQAPVRLFALPHAGGSASFFVPMAAALSPAVDVHAVQYPGRQDRRTEPNETDLARLADRIAEAVLARQDGRPYALFGHSMGAMLAFEVARRTESAGPGPAALFVSGRQAPCRDRADDWLPLTDEEIIEELRALDATSAGLLDDPEVQLMFLPALRADYQAVRTHHHRPGPPLRTSVTALTGDDDHMCAPAKADFWREHTDGDFELHVLPGGHFFLADRLDEVAAIVTDRLPHPSAVAA